MKMQITVINGDNEFEGVDCEGAAPIRLRDTCPAPTFCNPAMEQYTWRREKKEASVAIMGCYYLSKIFRRKLSTN